MTNLFINRRHAFTLKTYLSIKLMKWLISETISEQSIEQSISADIILW
jgi:hypothetical protein